VSAEPELEAGWVDTELAAEFPELGLICTTVEASSGRSPQSVKARLREMSNRFTGGRAVNLRQEPVPWAYRVFFRQVGIDPDDRRTPVEEAALERMKHGGFRSRNLLDDALTIAVIETGVPVIAFDADRVDGPVGLRLSEDRERLGGDGRSMAGGQIVVADAERSLAVLFGDMAEGRGVSPDTKRMLLAAVTVKGVPQVSVEEALWAICEVLTYSE
jgi:DNA/RNA-binding domain of Phe-tRNA-synthetase-like protein